NEMKVTLIDPEEERSTISDVENLTIQSQSGAALPLSSLVKLKEVQVPVSLQRENQQPQVNVTSEIISRDLGSVVGDVEQKLDQMSIPEGYSYEIGGQAQDMRSEEHTSELQSRFDLVCRLLLEKKKYQN